MLQLALFSGFLLLLSICGSLTVIHFRRYNAASVESGFYTLLRDYDFKHRRVLQEDLSQYQEINNLNRELDRLEQKAEGVENWLSILKRRRQIAARDTRYNQTYRQSAQRAALAFPYSEPIAIVASAALIRGSAISEETEEKLRETIPLITSPHYAPARLSFHILLDDFKNPNKAAENLKGESVEPELLTMPGGGAVKIIPDLVIMKILAGDISGAEAMINAVFAQEGRPSRKSNALIRIAAEFFYDYGDMLRSAELFSMLPDEDALIRQADALWLAGYTQNARNIWSMLAASKPRAMYNLAVTAQTQEEAKTLYDLFIKNTGTDDPYHRYGVIRYSRLMDRSKALVFLNSEKTLISNSTPAYTTPPLNQTTLSTDALFDLEIVKRHMENAETARTVAETWLLLDSYPKIEELYEWGAWFFTLRRNDPENALLLRAASRQKFTGQWKGIYKSLLQIYEGDIDGAEEILAPIPLDEKNWFVAANLGRIYEARLSPARAITNYEKAFKLLSGNAVNKAWKEPASKIQVRIANCYKLMGKISESREALEYALDLNPDNLNARLELNR